MKLTKNFTMVLAVFLLCRANGDITGTVTDASGPVAGAMVKLIQTNVEATTGADGTYSLATTHTAPRIVVHLPVSVEIKGGNLIFTSDISRRVSVRLYDISGNTLASLQSVSADKNPVRYRLPEPAAQKDVVLMKITYGNESAIYKVLPRAGIVQPLDRVTTGVTSSALAKISGVDILKVKKDGWVAQHLDVTSLEGVMDVVLETVPGIGCEAAALCMGFEDGTMGGFGNAWNPGEAQPRGPHPLIDQAQAHSGAYSMHYENMTGYPKRAVAINLPANFGPTLWGRVYMYITPRPPMPIGMTVDTDADPSTKGSSHAALIKSHYNDDLYWYEIGYERGEYLMIQHIPEPPGYPEWVLLTNRVPASGEWECVEWELDAASAGDPVLYVDGELIPFSDTFTWNDGFSEDKSTLYQNAVDFKDIWLGYDTYHDVNDVTMQLHYDDFAVATERIGCR